MKMKQVTDLRVYSVVHGGSIYSYLLLYPHPTFPEHRNLIQTLCPWETGLHFPHLIFCFQNSTIRLSAS